GELTVEGVREYDLTDSDRLNGFEWAGEVSFKQTPCREAGEQGVVLDGMAGISVFRQRGRWSQWIEFQPEAVKVQKVEGKWEIHQDTWLLRGRPPGPQDFAKAGVKQAGCGSRKGRGCLLVLLLLRALRGLFRRVFLRNRLDCINAGRPDLRNVLLQSLF